MELIKTFNHVGSGKLVNVYGTFEEPLFKAQEIGKMLGMTNIHKFLATVDPDWKVVTICYTLGGAQQTTFLKESGLYYTLMRSTKAEAKPFQKWVCEDVLPAIRKVGQYKLVNHKVHKNLTFNINNEEDLQAKVVQFLKTQYPESLFTATLGENQKTEELRLRSYKMGYLKGSPDLIIGNSHKYYKGFAIELKTPKGTGSVSEDQVKMLKKYKKNNFKVLVTNDYDKCIVEIIEYFRDVRICCEYCCRKFKNNESLFQHQKYIHRNIDINQDLTE